MGEGGRDLDRRGLRDAGATPWLKLQVVGQQYGPDNGSKLTATTIIQCLHTAGGAAPATRSASTGDLGARLLVPLGYVVNFK